MTARWQVRGLPAPLEAHLQARQETLWRGRLNAPPRRRHCYAAGTARVPDDVGVCTPFGRYAGRSGGISMLRASLLSEPAALALAGGSACGS
jgi:hypothetical protein